MAAAIGTGIALGQAGLQAGLDSLLPDARRLNGYNRPGTLTVLDANGDVLFKDGPVTRDRLPTGKMPKLVERAFVAAEDRRFYQHEGIDVVGIFRALMRNLREGSVEEGASTITQQLARTVYLDQDRTLWRKLKEAALAGKIERQLSKTQILEQYLNYVYLGSSAYGVADAAWVYFSKTPDQLSLPEVALIAGLPPAPSVYSPLINPDLALERRAIVLRRMREAGFIDDAQLERARSAPLALRPAEPKYYANPAPWFISWMEQLLPKVLSKEQLEVGGLTIRTGLYKAWQERAQSVVRQVSGGGGLQGALISMEPGTGLVRAMVGGTDWQKSQFNRATQALRSPGSTFKLFAYTAAIQYGMRPEDTISARERCYQDGYKRFCIPGAGGSMSLLSAITASVNPAAVALAEKVGYPRVIGVARQLGITGEIGEYPAMVLGSNEKTMLEMVAAYGAINNRGVYVQPTPFDEIYGPDGELLWSRRVDGKPPRRAVPSDVADTLMWMLQNVVNAGTGRPASLPDRPSAGKTGTAEGARDLWYIGSVPQLTTAIWFGYDENWKTGSSSATAAAAWYSYMSGLLKEIPVKQFPPKPVLSGSFIPYVPPKQRPGKKAPPAEIGPGGGSWESTVDDGSDARARRQQENQDPVERESRWQPPAPEPERPRWSPPATRRWTPQPEPAPAAPAPPPSPAAQAPAPAAPAAPEPAAPPAPMPAAPRPLPVSPPPPVSAPPPP
ncbi:MAG: PBP1A family penicillin-binding protein [Synechococcaceae cyanobacterium]|nr:PBP1A family penicillin-binding protein [Synechococcaceae cyanobacterium]